MNKKQLINEDKKRQLAWQLWYESGLSCFEFFKISILEADRSCWKK